MVRHSRKRSKRYRKQRGGAVFSNEQLEALGNLGFTDEQKKEFAGLLETQVANEPNLPDSVISLARIYLQQINPQTGRNRTPREFIDDEIELQNETFGGGKRRRKSRYTRKMVGGFTPEETNRLRDLGFTTQEHIDILSNTGIGLNIIEMSLHQNNPDTGALYTPQELINSVIEANEEIANLDDDAVVPDQENDANHMDVDGVADGLADHVENHYVEQGQGQGLNMADLEPESPRSVTEMGGRKTKTRKGRKSRKSRKQRGGTVFSEEQLAELGRLGFTDDQKKILAREFSITPANTAMSSIRQALQHNYLTGQPDTVESIMRMFPNEGGKRRRKSRKQRGGKCYGNGVGANAYDPNYSIYNTNQLQMFPYKPN